MGTRHLIVVVHQGRWRIAQYGQWDGYPEGVGMRIIKLLASAGFAQKLRDGLTHTYEVTAADDIVARPNEDADYVAALAELDHSPRMSADNSTLEESPFSRFTDDPIANYSPALLAMRPSLRRETSSAVLVLVAHATAENPIPLFLEPEFANDGLFCEWTYVVDLDQEVLEIYEGATAKTDDHRFVDVGGKHATVPTLILTIPFADVPKFEGDVAGLVKMVNESIDEINWQRKEADKDLDE